MRVHDNPEVPEGDECAPDAHDLHVRMHVLMNCGCNEAELTRFKKRLRDENRNPTGKAHNNPLLYTRIHEIEHEHGDRVPVAANFIVENLFNQVNDEGYRVMILDKVIDHETDDSELTKLGKNPRKRQKSSKMSKKNPRRRKKSSEMRQKS